MGAMASQITGLTIVYSTVNSGADQRKYQSSASLALVPGIHRWSVNSPHKCPATWKLFPFDDVIMKRGKFSPAWSGFEPKKASQCIGTLKLNSAWTKWSLFRRRYFQMHFREWKFVYASDAELWCLLWSAPEWTVVGWWFETPLRPLWRHSNDTNQMCIYIYIYIKLYSTITSIQLIEAEWRIYPPVN